MNRGERKLTHNQDLLVKKKKVANLNRGKENMPTRYLFNGTLLNLIVSKKRSLIKYKSQKLTQNLIRG